MGADRDAASAPNEDFFVANATNIQIKIDNIKHGQERKINIPADVATPFPPLNFRKGLYIWPKTKARQVKAYCNDIISWFSLSIINILFKYRGRKPFERSINKVKAAKDLFPVLNTLVAPIFPEPIFRMSPYPAIMETNNPKGIDPIKKPNIIRYGLVVDIKILILLMKFSK